MAREWEASCELPREYILKIMDGIKRFVNWEVLCCLGISQRQGSARKPLHPTNIAKWVVRIISIGDN